MCVICGANVDRFSEPPPARSPLEPDSSTPVMDVIVDPPEYAKYVNSAVSPTATVGVGPSGDVGDNSTSVPNDAVCVPLITTAVLNMLEFGPPNS